MESYHMDTICLCFMTIQISLLLCVASSSQNFCHENERSALLEFKRSHFINKNPYTCNPYGVEYRKIESWKLGEPRNCCAWDGIECDKDNGHVIAVELGNSCLSGNINSNTTIFHLVHLQRLDLSENCHLKGQLPKEILKLTNLSSLDLSSNYAMELKKPNLLDLVQNLKRLENLNLSRLSISTPIPNILADSLSLRSLRLVGCNLHGKFPPIIFNLPKLEFLDVSANEQLSGHLPEFHWRSSLKSFLLYGTNFSGYIPFSIGNLASLNELYLGYNNFIGKAPSSMGNLTQLTKLYICGNLLMGEIPFWIRNLTQLTMLSLSDNQLTGPIPSWIGQLSNLQWLELGSNMLTGDIPSSFVNLTQLTDLYLDRNHFNGQILPQLTKLTRLALLSCSFNNLSGSIPSSIAELKDLTTLHLNQNNLNGKVGISLFSELMNLKVLDLSFNKLSIVDDLDNTHSDFPKLRGLGLGSCNLNKFPTFLQLQDGLRWLDLSNNNMFSEIPEWFLDMNVESLLTLNLSSNSLTCSWHRSLSYRWKSLYLLDVRDNKLEGPLPVPPEYIQFYLASHNKFSGNLPSQICELEDIQGLDLANNNLTGELPQCLNNLSSTLSFLSLHDNNFIGEFSSILGNGDCNLKMADLSSNQFDGPLPRSLAKCYDLEFLNLGSNRIKDVFPSWLGSLHNLKVLIIHSNEFHGQIGEPKTNNEFPALQIVDLSSNNFLSCLPSSYFECWRAMKVPSSNQDNYMRNFITPSTTSTTQIGAYDYSMTIFIKGLKTSYPKIQNHLTFIDFSSNNFSCEIPRTIESLMGIHYLNFSNNNLIGPIPSFLKVLRQLQALDLSQNKLYGKIPQVLTELTFLETFNVSYNNLSGKIPEGQQFDTFMDDSYIGNRELCGLPLSKECGDIKGQSQPQPRSKGESEESIEINWIVVGLGYGSGLVLGIIIRQKIITMNTAGWILKYFGGRAQIRRT